MKNLERDFTLIVGQVPDDVKLKDCEIVIEKASASYMLPDGKWVTLGYEEGTSKDDVDIIVLSTRFVNPDGGEELESD